MEAAFVNEREQHGFYHIILVMSVKQFCCSPALASVFKAPFLIFAHKRAGIAFFSFLKNNGAISVLQHERASNSLHRFSILSRENQDVPNLL